ncbi:DUF2625 domain-containing protein [Siphonobacter sp. SORGH_AS_0500]|uniref:DUF2625 domain-containing protein n=1 Tax=Siphonobacter sp. SORGH_AS_0500 TaxID=1864824 RepID=UPI00285AA78E|nr:DUF2625 domain-containing protein [Siphonobacter sp. SORGH_AS_0500]MDR6196682.1 hypothetical protein [Siphonobacter sp. SORGH_AS_0500]
MSNNAVDLRHFQSFLRKTSTVLVLTLLTLMASAQNKMRPLEQLINETDSGWPLVQEWISKAKNKVQVLPCNTNRAKDALYKTQVTTRSPMGAIVYATGGLLIDHGWIRVLGSGCSKLNRSLPDWNKGKSFKEFGQRPGVLLIADDVAGGFFAVNGGALGSDAGKVYYLSPDQLEWVPLDLTYTDFLHFCFNGDLATFYKDLRWKNWKSDVEKLNGDTVFNFYPYLWTKEGQNINKVSRKPVPIEEQYLLNLDLIKQLLEKKNGS